MNYTIPKPSYPIFLKLLTGLVITGLVGLGIVAFETFSLVHGPFVAGIFALVIEVGAAIDSIGLAGGINKRSWWLIPAILITIAVSSWYNLATVDRGSVALAIEDKNTLWWVERAIAWGPLASLAFMALGVGFRISDHEQSVKQWEINRQAYLDKQVADAEKRKIEQEEREQKAHERDAQIQAQLEYQKAKLQTDAQERERLAQIAAQEREAKREARLRERELTQQAEKLSVITQKLHKGSYDEFSTAMITRNGQGPLSVEEIQASFNVSRKTAYNWLNKYRLVHSVPQAAVGPEHKNGSAH